MKRKDPRGSRAPSITTPFSEARALLTVRVDADARTIKRAYRSLVAEHPPDRDPDGFRRIRDAYEMLTNPLEPAKDILMDTTPRVTLPPVRAEDLPDRGALTMAVLRLYAAELDASILQGKVSG